MTLLRSLLFVPGNQPRKLQRAVLTEADAVILDLEDAVPPAEKLPARAAARDFLLRPEASGPMRIVRINAITGRLGAGDLEAVVGPGLDAVMLPKAEGAADVVACAVLISHFERERGLPEGRIGIQPLIETAEGLARAGEIGRASERVRFLTFGAGDFSLDCRISWSRDNPLLLAARLQLVLESRRAGLEPPVDTVFPLLEDGAGLASEASEGRRIGFQGKLTIHPRQVEVVNSVFTPSAGELDFARRVCAEFDRARQEGSAATVVDGIFVDHPIALRAERLLQTAAGAAGVR